MKKIILLWSLFIFSCQNDINVNVSPTNPGAANLVKQSTEKKYSLMERELEYLTSIWDGEYDNVEQLDFDKYADKEGFENGGHLRMHSFFTWVDLPAFGKYVIYEETYKKDNPNEVYRQCLYHLSPDDDAKKIKLERYHIKSKKSVLSVGEDISFIKKLKPNSKVLEKGCEMSLQREGMDFIGKTNERDCLENSETAQHNIDFQIKISKEGFWFRDQKYHKETGAQIPDAQQLSWYQLEKSRCFVCMVDFPREAGGRPVKTEHYIKIHDQGGKFEFDYTDGRHMVLGMRNTWSFGMQRETFVIFIQEENQKGKTLIYSWGNPGADRIGFNPGWIRVQCDLDTPDNVALQQTLRPDS